MKLRSLKKIIVFSFWISIFQSSVAHAHDLASGIELEIATIGERIAQTLSGPTARCGGTETLLAAQDPACAKYRLQAAIVSPSDPHALLVNGQYIDPRKLPIEILLNYRQARYELVDPLSDYALARAIRQAVIDVSRSLARKQSLNLKFETEIEVAASCAQRFFGIPPQSRNTREPDRTDLFENPEHIRSIESLSAKPGTKAAMIADYHSGKLNLEGHTHPFTSQGLLNMLSEVIAEEAQLNGILPKIGAKHSWSSDFKSRFANSWSYLDNQSKILDSLAGGTTSKYLVAGTEGALREWILKQDYRSVTMDGLFRESYRLNGGDVYLAILAIENSFNQNWKTPGRETLSTSLRMKWIINSLGHSGNNFGQWYHTFGIILYGYVAGETKARAAAKIERIGSHRLSPGADRIQEDDANNVGAQVGARLRKNLETGVLLSAKLRPELATPERYLNLGEDFTARLQELAAARESMASAPRSE